MAGRGVVTGIVAFSCVLLSAPMASPVLFFAGAVLIGLGSGLFAVSTLTAAMTVDITGTAGRGLALGVWGAAQATAAGLSIFIGGGLRDLVGAAALNGSLGPVLTGPSVGYSAVYQLEITLLFITLIALGPLVRAQSITQRGTGRLELPEFPT